MSNRHLIFCWHKINCGIMFGVSSAICLYCAIIDFKRNKMLGEKVWKDLKKLELLVY